jgi:hypothetical protein
MASVKEKALCIIQLVKANSVRSMQLEFLGSFAKLGKVTTSFVMSVCREQLGFHWMDFHDFYVTHTVHILTIIHKPTYAVIEYNS